MTLSSRGMSSPRAATSVVTKMCDFAARNLPMWIFLAACQRGDNVSFRVSQIFASGQGLKGCAGRGGGLRELTKRNP